MAGEDVIVPGKPDDSSIYWTTTLPLDDELVMPPYENEEKDYPLRDEEKKILEDWILAGADWPEDVVLEPRKRLPKEVVFVEHVQPILEQNCVACHYDGKVKGDLRLDTFEHAFAAEHVIVPGKPLDSDLWVLCTLPQDDEMFMPPEGNDPLSALIFLCFADGLKRVRIGQNLQTFSPKRKALPFWVQCQRIYVQGTWVSSPGKFRMISLVTGRILSHLTLHFEMLPIKGGVFNMGSPADDEKRGKE